jgi:hypothetical protein
MAILSAANNFRVMRAPLARRTCLLLACLGIAFPAVAQAQAPPALRGKSVVVSWTENRSLRAVGQPAFHDTQTPFSTAIYVSALGRPFIRQSARPHRQVGSADYVGAEGSTQSGGSRQVQFQASSLVVTTSMTAGGARRIVVDFDASYSRCTARVTTAKQVGAEIIRSRSLATGKPLEIRSVAVAGTRCSVRDGNVFAD